ncbi:hypothetical protein [Fundidesulfovibrio putealis]|uniref:hypothetical protein n=1 Tax=Fundidesulfovibrio putealis TaxID=270496 RepID=UPI0012EBCE6E|nr:hypothetical protein [Fundidesulfovibrio putealis]
MKFNVTFSHTPKQFEEMLMAEFEKPFREAVIELFTRIIQRTPVDTGRAKANWQPANGRYIEDRSLNQYDKEGTATINKVRDVLSKWKLSDGFVSLCNNLNYIVPLEYGFSNKAPTGMVRISIEEWDDIVNEAWAKAQSK